ncbi:hypothetical protein ABT124_34475 [Streptomyces sp. NPDC001982]|uniref:hypothetical protein n=1 Tax=Streptomyces sp. NPDC001982 TaxID=3154405 RepID=UPI0033320C3E
MNGIEVGRHRGGFSGFTFDITDAAPAGVPVPLVLRARDDPEAPQARGKQSVPYAPRAAKYWRTTGIWQTVWLEPVPSTAIRRRSITPNVAAGALDVEVPLSANLPSSSWGGSPEVYRRSIAGSAKQRKRARPNETGSRPLVSAFALVRAALLLTVWRVPPAGFEPAHTAPE